MQQPGPDKWHPNPAFLFQEGAGPVFDIGPYYLTALVQMFGPVAAVAAVDSKSRETRVIVEGPKAGEEFAVTVPSQTATLVQFVSGQSLTMLLSFDSAVPRILLEVTGSEGTLLLPDPNMFDGEIQIRAMGAEEWETAEKTTALSSRGTGVLDMARAIRADRPHRAQGALAYHVLDIMVAIAESGQQGRVRTGGEHRRAGSTAARRLGSEGRDPLTTTVQLLGFVALARSADGADPTNRSRFRRGAARSRSGR